MADINVEQNTNKVGNTKQPSSNSKTRTFLITFNNYTELELEQFEQWLEVHTEENQYQEEIGKQGTPHIQACFKFKNPRSLSSVIKELHEISKKIHVEPTRNWNRAVAYCSKQDTKVEGGKAGGNALGDVVKIADPMENLTFKDWQIEIDEIVKEKPSERIIYWYYDKKGGAGKTTYAKHLYCEHGKSFIYLSGKANDVKCGVATAVNGGNPPKVCVFDFCRTSENFISYESIETIKNGIFFNGKYESSMIVFPVPHVIIFANFAPDTTKLSIDRWVVKDITSK